VRSPTLQSELSRLEAELNTLERKGVLVDVPYPHYEAFEADEQNPPSLRVSGIAAMNSNILIAYVRDFDLHQPGKGPALVIDEERSYSAVLQGEGTIVRFDSGHATHSPNPHLHTSWTSLAELEPPTMPLASSIELGNFIDRIEDWRLDHLHHLPTYPASLANVRWP